MLANTKHWINAKSVAPKINRTVSIIMHAHRVIVGARFQSNYRWIEKCKEDLEPLIVVLWMVMCGGDIIVSAMNWAVFIVTYGFYCNCVVFLFDKRKYLPFFGSISVCHKRFCAIVFSAEVFFRLDWLESVDSFLKISCQLLYFNFIILLWEICKERFF